MHEDVHETAEWLGKVVNGWLNYYAVPTSGPTLRGFVRRLMWILATHLARAVPEGSDSDRQYRAPSRPCIGLPYEFGTLGQPHALPSSTRGRSRMR